MFFATSLSLIFLSSNEGYRPLLRKTSSLAEEMSKAMVDERCEDGLCAAEWTVSLWKCKPTERREVEVQEFQEER